MKSSILTSILLADCIAGYAIEPRSSSSSEPATSDSACRSTGKAVYLLTNDVPNAVVALPIDADGKLSRGTVTPTGGNGAASIDGTTMQPAGPDALASQSSLTVVDNKIFAVNAGSNTVSMLSISAEDPTALTLVGAPAAVPGDFPNTVAASARHGLACAATSGAAAGVSCARFSDDAGGLGAFDALRPFPLGQSTPPVGPTNTVSQIFANADESAFLTTVKGDPATNKTGFLSTLPIIVPGGRGRASSSCRSGVRAAASVARRDLRSSPGGTAVLFGAQNIPGSPDGDVFATDASFGAVVLSVDGRTGAASTRGRRGAVAGQRATCWAAVSDAAPGVAFVTDVGVPHLVEMSTADARELSSLDLSRTTSSGSGGAGAGLDPGFIDLQAGPGGMLYLLSPGNGTLPAAVIVVDVAGGRGAAREVQRLSLGDEAGKNAQGMAVLK
ncbi:hypothetical protein GGR56DRAFT_687138 [Xylariaceae sp. FL0804]|nr:hypothetical protein GGR56DRAFT_687138 [Xylariaceae sp. FL0804]